jgi:serine/threonine protein kinase
MSPLAWVARILGHYRLIEQVGAVDMGVVFRARDERLERDVALKILPAGTLADDASRGSTGSRASMSGRYNSVLPGPTIFRNCITLPARGADEAQRHSICGPRLHL